MTHLQPLGGAPGWEPSLEVDVVLPWTAPPLSLNDTGATRQAMFSKAKKIHNVRDAVLALASRHNLPKDCVFARVQLHYLPADNRRRDTDNCVATLKPICDALAAGTTKHPGHGLVPDDTPQYMQKPEPIIYHHPPKTPPKMWITITTWNNQAPPTSGALHI